MLEARDGSRVLVLAVIGEEKGGEAGRRLSSGSACDRLACSWAILALLWPPWFGAVGSEMKHHLGRELWLSLVFLGLFGGDRLGRIVQSQ